jgi:integrase
MLVPVDGSIEHRIDVTKSKKSRRVIALDEQTVAVLRTHRKRQATERMASPIWHDLDLVFTNEIGEPIRPTTFSRTWKRLAIEAGVTPLTPHPGARHGWATLALQAGVPMKVVQEQLGHASLAITGDIYSHVSEDLARDAIEKVMAAV